MARCWSCGQEKVQVDAPSDVRAPVDALTHNARILQGFNAKCAENKCGTQVFTCFACARLTDGKPLCVAHDVCGANVSTPKNATKSCAQAIAWLSYCEHCDRMFRRCRQRQHSVKECPDCKRLTKGGVELESRLRALALPVSVPIATPAIESCPFSKHDSFVDTAIWYAGRLADWLQSHGPSHEVEVGHQTLCVTILEKSDGSADPKIKVLLTHSGSNVYVGAYEKKRTIRYKVATGKNVRGNDNPKGMRKLGIAFMEANRKGIGDFLAEFKRTNASNSIMLPETDPMVFYYRDRKEHYLLIPDSSKKLVEQQTQTEKSTGLRAALKFAETKGFCLESMGLYQQEQSNAHHAEMRAIKYAHTYGYAVVAMAPTKGCCTSVQRANNCHDYLKKHGLLDRIPKERQTQDGYNEYLKQQGIDTGEPDNIEMDLVKDEDISDIQLMLAIAASLEDANGGDAFVKQLQARFEIIPVEPDGNCLFAAVSTGIHQHQNNAAHYREAAVDYVRDNFRLEEVQAAWKDCTSLDDYHREMSVPAENSAQVERYGGYLELVALSELYDVEFHIYSAQWSIDKPLVIPEGGLSEPELVVSLHYRNRNHYEVLF